jgi:2-polyprenyl-3-methyl-5-hydroxy-6-metoxy-1,4-benzoquinol methylase
MIRNDGWQQYNIWEHSSTVKDLYARRCRMEAEEMTCAAQAAALLQPHITPGDTLLDVGCGSGYFYHSLHTRNLPVEYYGIDASPSLIEIGCQIMPEYGLAADRLRIMRIEDLAGYVDHVLCMNVLSNIDNYHRPLERLLNVAQKTLILRESISDNTTYRYVHDKYLDQDVQLNVYVNTYSRHEVRAFIEGYGFDVQEVVDWRTQGQAEMVIDYPHHWTFIVARRIKDNQK